MVATEGDEVVVAEGVVTLQLARHEDRLHDGRCLSVSGVCGVVRVVEGTGTLPRSCRKERVMNGAPAFEVMIGPPATRIEVVIGPPARLLGLVKYVLSVS